MNFYSKTAIGLAALAIAGAASAQKAGDDVFSLGVAVITQDISVGTLTSTGGAASSVVTSNLVGANASTSGATTLSASWLHMFTNNIATELTLGAPPRIKMNINTPSGNSLNSKTHDGAAEADVLTPALVAKYLFNTPADKFRPYAGLGVSYISFQNVTANGGSSGAALDVTHLAGNGAKLDDSWAPVYNLGMIYNINDRWSINGSISYIPIETKLTMTGNPTSTYGTTSGTIKFNTTDYVVRVGYKF
jgi:outer membrane protein